MLQFLRRRPSFPIGLLIILGALALELMPNTQAGIGPLQIAAMVFGLIVMAWSFLPGKSAIGISLLSIVFSLVLLEFLLGFTGFSPAYSGKIATSEEIEAAISPIWLCDMNSGCRFDAQAVEAEFAAHPELPERFGLVNEQGYPDTEDFTEANRNPEAFRILTLGDSFTWGASADLGQSWAELISRDAVQVWNTGIPATGTRNALVNARRFAPIMQPDLVILGFFYNDLSDNLYPVDNGVRLTIPENPSQLIFAKSYDLDGGLNPIPLSHEEIYYRYYGYRYPQNFFEEILLSTRLGSRAYFAQESFFAGDAERRGQSREISRALLSELASYLDEAEIPFIALLIPDEETVAGTEERFSPILSLFDELGISYINPIGILEAGDYAEEADDGHWNNSGHGKVAALLSECIAEMQASGTSACQALTIP